MIPSLRPKIIKLIINKYEKLNITCRLISIDSEIKADNHKNVLVVRIVFIQLNN